MNRKGVRSLRALPTPSSLFLCALIAALAGLRRIAPRFRPSDHAAPNTPRRPFARLARVRTARDQVVPVTEASDTTISQLQGREARPMMTYA